MRPAENFRGGELAISGGEFPPPPETCLAETLLWTMMKEKCPENLINYWAHTLVEAVFD